MTFPHLSVGFFFFFCDKNPGADTFSVRNAETEVFDRILLVTEKAVLSLKRTTQTNPKENNKTKRRKK